MTALVGTYCPSPLWVSINLCVSHMMVPGLEELRHMHMVEGSATIQPLTCVTGPVAYQAPHTSSRSGQGCPTVFFWTIVLQPSVPRGPNRFAIYHCPGTPQNCQPLVFPGPKPPFSKFPAPHHYLAIILSINLLSINLFPPDPLVVFPQSGYAKCGYQKTIGHSVS